MNPAIEKFKEEKVFALCGVSADTKKFGNYIVKELTARGYTMIPVHPSLEEVEGVRCLRTLDAVAGRTRSLIICVKPERAVGIIKEAASLGFERVWLQQGSGSPAAIEEAKNAGLEVVSGKCILMNTEPVKGIHRFHRAIATLFGKG